MNQAEEIIRLMEGAGFRVNTAYHILTEGLIVSEGYTVEAVELATGEKWIVKAVELDDAMTELAGETGFDSCCLLTK